MERLGLDCYGLISITNIKDHLYSDTILNNGTPMWNWKCISSIIQYNEFDHFMHYDIIYDINVNISGFLERYDRKYSVWSPLFFYNFITGLAHEIRHVWQHINCCDMNDEEAEIDAATFEAEFFDKSVDKKYYQELIINLTRTFSCVSRTGSQYIWMQNGEPPIIRNIKDVNGNEI
jgi:hypothetical protein